MPKLEFFFDFGSPYTYYAAERLIRDERYRNVDIEWTPILLGGLFKATGNRPPAEVVPKGVYMLKDLQRLGAHYGYTFTFPAAFPVNSLMPMRGATALKLRNDPRFVDHAMAMFRAYWGAGKDISDPQIWAETVKSAGLDPDEIRGAIETPEVKDALKAATGRAAELGLFGVPSFIVDGELYWGFDRMFLVDEVLGLPAAERL